MERGKRLGREVREPTPEALKPDMIVTAKACPFMSMARLGSLFPFLRGTS